MYVCVYVCGVCVCVCMCVCVRAHAHGNTYAHALLFSDLSLSRKLIWLDLDKSLSSLWKEVVSCSEDLYVTKSLEFHN